jgi:ribosome-associated toxin RatA of RatAB toxin-antitoxin module
MNNLVSYVFQSRWLVPAPTDECYDVLRDIEAYPQWWPEIKEVHMLDNDTASLRARSFLPYYLDFESSRSRDDREAGVLEARLSGDLDGFSRWTIVPTAEGSMIVFDEEVVTSKRLLNVLAPIARPAFKMNHTFMMRHGEAGLRTFLAGRHWRPAASE